MDYISITQNPKTEYFSGETFDSTGLVVTAHYEDGSSNQVTGYILDIPNIINNGTSNISVTVMVFFENKFTHFQIIVKPILVESIGVSYTYPIFGNLVDDNGDLLPSRDYYFSGEEFDSSGVSVIAIYNDGSLKPVSGYTLHPNPPNMTNNTENNVTRMITVTYIEKSITVTDTFSIIISPVFLGYIVVSRLPKTSYFLGEIFDPSGLEIIGFYSNGEPIEDKLENYSLTSPNMNIVGPQTITVTYYGKTTTFIITVNSRSLSSISIKENPNTEYFVGNVFNSAGLEIIGHYNDGTSVLITSYSLSTPDMSSTGIKVVTVTHGSMTANFNITIREMPTPLEINKEHWQHIRFRMPDHDLTLELKWIERLFRISFNKMELFIKNTIIFDLFNDYNYNGTYKTDGLLKEIGQSNFPYYTYPYVMVGDIPTKNKIIIFSLLTDSAYFKPEDSKCYYKGSFGGIKLTNNEFKNNFGVVLGNPANDYPPSYLKDIFLSFHMRKSDMEFFVKTGVNIGQRFILITNDFTTGNSISLDEGVYTIWAAGARGGNQGIGGDAGSIAFSNSGSGGAFGSFGMGIKCMIKVDQSVSLTYKLGLAGGGGGGGAAGSGGFLIFGGSSGGDGGKGGGGGASVITFSSDVEVLSCTYNDDQPTNYTGPCRSIGLKGGDGGGSDAHAFDSIIMSAGGLSEEIANMFNDMISKLPGAGGRRATGSGEDGGGGKGGSSGFNFGLGNLGGKADDGFPGVGGVGFKYGVPSRNDPDDYGQVLRRLINLDGYPNTRLALPRPPRPGWPRPPSSTENLLKSGLHSVFSNIVPDAIRRHFEASPYVNGFICIRVEPSIVDYTGY